jgi:hypothetical protein
MNELLLEIFAKAKIYAFPFGNAGIPEGFALGGKYSEIPAPGGGYL